MYHGGWPCDFCQGQSVQGQGEGQGHKLKANAKAKAGQSQGKKFGLKAKDLLPWV